MKIDNKELDEMKSIVYDYSTLQTEFDEIQKRLEIIHKEKDILLERLEKVHERENVFYGQLKDKYGDGTLDLNSLEYKQ